MTDSLTTPRTDFETVVGAESPGWQQPMATLPPTSDPKPTTQKRKIWPWTVAALLAAVLLAAAALWFASENNDLTGAIDAAGIELADTQEELTAVEADRDDVQAELATVNADLADAEAELNDASAAIAEAEASREATEAFITASLREGAGLAESDAQCIAAEMLKIESPAGLLGLWSETMMLSPAEFETSDAGQELTFLTIAGAGFCDVNLMNAALEP